MIDDAREMVAIKAAVPDQVVEHVTDVLHRAIMTGIRFRKESLAKNFQDEKRALNEGISAGQEIVVPDAVATERRDADDKSEDSQDKAANPFLAEQGKSASAEARRTGQGRSVGCVHVWVESERAEEDRTSSALRAIHVPRSGRGAKF